MLYFLISKFEYISGVSLEKLLDMKTIGHFFVIFDLYLQALRKAMHQKRGERSKGNWLSLCIFINRGFPEGLNSLKSHIKLLFTSSPGGCADTWQVTCKSINDVIVSYLQKTYSQSKRSNDSQKGMID